MDYLMSLDYWFLDIGSTEYMCHGRSFFFTFRGVSHEYCFVQGIDGAELQVMGIGDIVIKIKSVDQASYGLL